MQRKIIHIFTHVCTFYKFVRHRYHKINQSRIKETDLAVWHSFAVHVISQRCKEDWWSNCGQYGFCRKYSTYPSRVLNTMKLARPLSASTRR